MNDRGKIGLQICLHIVFLPNRPDFVLSQILLNPITFNFELILSENTVLVRSLVH